MPGSLGSEWVGLDVDELSQVLSDHFQSALWTSDESTTYQRDGRPALQVDYRLDNPVEFRPLEMWRPDDLEAVRRRIADVREHSSIAVGRTILFVRRPVIGKWVASTVHLLPVPPEAPRPRWPLNIGDHPLLLEYEFQDAPSGVGPLRSSRRGHELALLLAGLLHEYVAPLPRDASPTWVRDQPDKYANLQRGYWFEGFSFRSERFSPVDEIPDIPVEDPVGYYQARGLGETFSLPASLGRDLELLAGMDAVDYRRAIAFCFWYRLSSETARHSTSVAFGALIAALEALLPPEKGRAACPSCGRPTGPSTTDSFIRFLDRMVPGAEQEKNRRALYRLRSKLFHGNLLPQDLGRGPFPLTPATYREIQQTRYARDLAQLAFRAWIGGGGTDGARQSPLQRA